MEVHEFTIMVVDHDEVGVEEASEIFENIKYPNHCMSPKVMRTKTVEICEWSDDLPINQKDKIEQEYRRLFCEN